MRPFFFFFLFFFLFTIIVTLVNPGINRQIRLQRDRVQTGRGGRHLCICSAAPVGQTALLPAGTWGRTISEGARSPFCGVEGWLCALGVEQQLGSHRLAVISCGGWWECSPVLGVLPTCAKAISCTQDGQPAVSTGRRPGLWEESLSKSTGHKHPGSLHTPPPRPAHTCDGGVGAGD